MVNSLTPQTCDSVKEHVKGYCKMQWLRYVKNFPPFEGFCATRKRGLMFYEYFRL